MKRIPIHPHIIKVHWRSCWVSEARRFLRSVKVIREIDHTIHQVYKRTSSIVWCAICIWPGEMRTRGSRLKYNQIDVDWCDPHVRVVMRHISSILCIQFQENPDRTTERHISKTWLQWIKCIKVNTMKSMGIDGQSWVGVPNSYTTSCSLTKDETKKNIKKPTQTSSLWWLHNYELVHHVVVVAQQNHNPNWPSRPRIILYTSRPHVCPRELRLIC